MNAIRNERPAFDASERRPDFASSATRCNERRWAAILRAFDAASTAALWAVFASAVARFWIFPGSSAETSARAASTLIFLTFATVGVYALRETVCVERERPYWLPPSEFRARIFSFAAPLGATALVVLSALWFWADASFATCCAVGVYALCVDAFAGRFARRWGATVARDASVFCESFAASTSETKPVPPRELAPSDEIFDDVNDETTAICVDENEEGEEDEEDGEMLATQRRVRAADGGERIGGVVAVEFEADAEIAPVFISFCPPFEGVPSFDFEQVAGPEVVLRATSVQPFGVRLEAKRRNAQTSEPQEFADDEKIRLEYFASFPPFDETGGAEF